MAGRSQGSEVGAMIGGLIVLVIAFYIIKWLAITAAILALPFGIWWVYDYSLRQQDQAVDQSQ